MAQVIVRNLDKAVVDALKARAQRAGHSLEQELRLILAAAAEPAREAVVQAIARLPRPDRAISTAELARLIREDRER